MSSESSSLQLWSDYRSPNAWRVEIVLREKDITDIQRAEADLGRRAYKTPEFLDKNPFGGVPALQDGQLFLSQCRTIAWHIAKKFAHRGNDILPPAGSLNEESLSRMFAGIEQDEISKHAHVLYYECVVKKFFKQSADETLVNKHSEILQRNLTALNHLMAKSNQKYMAGDKFSLIDCFQMSSFHMIGLCGKEELLLKEKDRLRTWWNEVSQRPAWKKLLDDIHQFYLSMQQQKS